MSTLNNKDIISRILSTVSFGFGEDACWTWLGGTRNGYGRMSLQKRIFSVHRVIWSCWYGEIPEGMLVCHHCDNPSCVNPKHLFIGTQNDNMQDMINKNRQADVAGEKNPRAKLSQEDVEEIREIYRIGNASYKDLSIVFDMAEAQIGRIIRKEHWIET